MWCAAVVSQPLPDSLHSLCGGSALQEVDRDLPLRGVRQVKAVVAVRVDRVSAQRLRGVVAGVRSLRERRVLQREADGALRVRQHRLGQRTDALLHAWPGIRGSLDRLTRRGTARFGLYCKIPGGLPLRLMWSR